MTRHRESSLFNKGDNRQIFKGTAVVAIGKNLNALLRLVVIAIVLRGLGTEAFATYSVVLALLTIADWVLDFGTNDVFVREVSADASKLSHLWSDAFVLRTTQVLPAIAIYLFAFWLIAPNDVIAVGIITAASIPFYTVINNYRALFLATMTMEKEMLAEFVSVVSLAPMIVLTLWIDAGVVGLAWSIFASRGVFLIACMTLSPNRLPRISGCSREGVTNLFLSSWIIGTIGLVAAVNNSLEILVLSAFSTPNDTAFFSAAHKLMTPALLAMTAVGIAFYPVISRAWKHDREMFEKRIQQSFDAVFLFGGLIVSGFVPGAGFLLNIVSPGVVAASTALQVIMIASLFKAAAAVVGPVLYIVRSERLAMAYFTVGVAIKLISLILVVPEYGYIGAAWTVLAVETCFVFPATMAALIYKTQYRFRMGRAFRTLLAIGMAIVLSMEVTAHPLMAGMISGVLYCALVFALKVTSMSSLRDIVTRDK